MKILIASKDSAKLKISTHLAAWTIFETRFSSPRDVPKIISKRMSTSVVTKNLKMLSSIHLLFAN